MKNVIKQKLNLILIVALFIVTASCSLMKSIEPAEAAVVHFHNQYNERQFREIYNQADEEFKKSASEAEFLELFENLRRKLGTVKESKQVQWNVNTTSSGTFITLVYDVEFSEGKGTEQFVFRMNGDKALLYDYSGNSPLLNTK